MNLDEPDEPWYFENRQRKVSFDEDAIRTFLGRLADDVAEGGGFSVVISSDRALREANRRYRNVPRTTDVLSFPDGEDRYWGDLLISAARAERQAARYGHSVEQEIQVLALHGMLHLRGYDHESDQGEMQAAEERFRRRYGLAQGLTARGAS